MPYDTPWPREGKNRLKAKPIYLNLTSGANLQLSGESVQGGQGTEDALSLFVEVSTELTKEKKNIYIYSKPMVKEDLKKKLQSFFAQFSFLPKHSDL